MAAGPGAPVRPPAEAGDRRGPRGTPRRRSGAARALWPSLAAALFLALAWTPRHHWDEYFYLFSALEHSPRALIALESEGGLFPSGFFSGKIGHIVLLKLLIRLFGAGERALALIQTAYALMVLGFVAAARGLLGELVGQRRAARAALVLLFLPVTLYLGFKTLSEVPGLLLAAAGSWAFLRSVRASGGARPALGSAAALALAAATLCRVTGIVFFAGLVAGLLAAGDPRFPRRAVAERAIGIALAVAALTSLTLWLLGGSDLPSVRLAYRVATRPNPLERVAALLLFLQSFAIALAFLPRPPWSRGLRLAAVWLAVCACPFLVGHEPRYYAPALVPLALLAAAGVARIGRLAGRRAEWGWIGALAGLVLVNRAFIAPLMAYEVDQRSLTALVDGPALPHSDPTYLVSWSSDYSFLRFAFPGKRIRLVLSETLDSDYRQRGRPGPLAPPDRAWAGPDGYVGSLAELAPLPHPWYYLGWTYNPIVLRLRDLTLRLGSRYLDPPARLGLHNHLAGSWIWYDSSLVLEPAARAGQYYAFRVLDGREAPGLRSSPPPRR